MNVHHGSLFPDIVGAADFCNVSITELKREEQLTDKAQESSISRTDQEVSLEDIREESLEYKCNKEKSEDTEKTISTIRQLLAKPNEAKRLDQKALNTILQEISKAVDKSTILDWDKRDAQQAEIRNKTRVLLRKYGYPIEARDYVIDNITCVIKNKV